MAKIIDGKALSDKLRLGIRDRVTALKASGIVPGLAVVLAGEDPASKVYVKNKIAACEFTGIKSFAYYLPHDVSQAELDELIVTLNADPSVHGILVQLPLPPREPRPVPPPRSVNLPERPIRSRRNHPL